MKTLILAAAAACALTVGAWAAPKEADKTCEAGKGKAVCCKASVANHCGYVSCCEVGNAGFFSKKHCGTCESHRDHAQAACAAGKTAKADAKTASGCAAKGSTLYVSCCDVGNARFFKAAHACGSGCEAKKASACCAAGK